MLITNALLACTLIAPTSAAATAFGSSFDAMLLPGVWELTGVGGEHNLTAPQRMVIVFEPAGEFHTSVWEDCDIVPQEVTGRYTTSGDLLTLTVRGPDSPERFRVAWRHSVLVLQPVEDMNQRPAIPLHFEKRPWVSP